MDLSHYMTEFSATSYTHICVCNVFLLHPQEESQFGLKAEDLYSHPHTDAVTVQHEGKHSCSI